VNPPPLGTKMSQRRIRLCDSSLKLHQNLFRANRRFDWSPKLYHREKNGTVTHLKLHQKDPLREKHFDWLTKLCELVRKNICLLLGDE
jgi:hypothetical protein